MEITLDMIVKTQNDLNNLIEHTENSIFQEEVYRLSEKLDGLISAYYKNN